MKSVAAITSIPCPGAAFEDRPRLWPRSWCGGHLAPLGGGSYRFPGPIALPRDPSLPAASSRSPVDTSTAPWHPAVAGRTVRGSGLVPGVAAILLHLAEPLQLSLACLTPQRLLFACHGHRILCNNGPVHPHPVTAGGTVWGPGLVPGMAAILTHSGPVKVL